MVPELAARLNAWFGAHARPLPWRAPGYGAWGVLVSEFMLQQTPVARVVPLLSAWLEPLTGIGDYTARAVAVFAYGDRHPVVDTNTRRVIARAVDGRAQPGPAARRDLAAMAALLPEPQAEAAVFNAAAMELGATVCTARAPRCGDCPIADLCAWRAADYPDTGDTRRRQARYEGSDRQTRGAVLRVLRDAPGHEAPIAEVVADWPDPAQRDRAIDSLIADGLAEASDGVLRLPR
ncbi:MAG: adenine glycosylase [Microbacterium sp.]|nr:adenine glycosylase [Microbacterium sp.]